MFRTLRATFYEIFFLFHCPFKPSQTLSQYRDLIKQFLCIDNYNRTFFLWKFKESRYDFWKRHKNEFGHFMLTNDVSWAANIPFNSFSCSLIQDYYCLEHIHLLNVSCKSISFFFLFSSSNLMWFKCDWQMLRVSIWI